ncbi:MAG: acyl carrier protein [Planctomycetota bacterium]|jgi:acyl carrier protein
MNKEEVKNAVKDIIETIAPDEDIAGLNDHDLLRDQIELDSMDFLDIVMELRKRYGVQVPEDDYKELGSLDSCAKYLHPLMEEKELKLQNA